MTAAKNSKEERVSMKFGDMNPARRAEEAMRWCIEREHGARQLCCVCAAEAIQKTMDGGVKLAGGISDAAVLLEAAGKELRAAGAKMRAQNKTLRAKVAQLHGVIERIERCEVKPSPKKKPKKK